MNDLFDTANFQNSYSGVVEKMLNRQQNPIQYQFVIGQSNIPLNALIGKEIRLSHQGVIRCLHCKKQINKSYGQGYCYDHFMQLASNDSCMMSPEKCHFEQGTCRDNRFAESVCNQGHYVYLANTSEVKVGITRSSQIPTRWMDQGAKQAMVIARVSTRHLAGCVEVIFKQFIADKTNWRNMLKGDAQLMDLNAIRDECLFKSREQVQSLQEKYGLVAIQMFEHGEVVEFNFPVNQYPEKITSLNLDKNPEIQGCLKGIKGQYLIFDTGVINIRKYSGYELTIEY
ncbi:DUF2797 domain-containing protein [Marinicellulosiphila megalodicopiae]|uniref:DUF2797 domain-containing protein n=1 Tax=Marinicellulosiphila megalodicopiae TaxID=2724896 RepID=UPI003BB06651